MGTEGEGVQLASGKCKTLAGTGAMQHIVYDTIMGPRVGVLFAVLTSIDRILICSSSSFNHLSFLLSAALEKPPVPFPPMPDAATNESSPSSRNSGAARLG